MAASDCHQNDSSVDHLVKFSADVATNHASRVISVRKRRLVAVATRLRFLEDLPGVLPRFQFGESSPDFLDQVGSLSLAAPSGLGLMFQGQIQRCPPKDNQTPKIKRP